jgi:hypothetical protein
MLNNEFIDLHKAILRQPSVGWGGAFIFQSAATGAGGAWC